MDQWEDEELSIKKFGEEDIDEILEEELFGGEADPDEIRNFQERNSNKKSLGTFGEFMKSRSAQSKSARRKKA